MWIYLISCTKLLVFICISVKVIIGFIVMSAMYCLGGAWLTRYIAEELTILIQTETDIIIGIPRVGEYQWSMLSIISPVIMQVNMECIMSWFVL